MMNSRVLQVFLYEFRRNIRRKGYLLATLGIPILGFLLMFGFQLLTELTGSNPADIANEIDFSGIQRAGYIDQTGLLPQPQGDIGERLLQFETVEAAQAALDNKDIDVFYVIDADFMETGNLTEYMREMSLTHITKSPIAQLLRENIGQDIEEKVLLRLQYPSNVKQINLTRSLEGDSADNVEADIVLIYVFSIIFLTAIFMTNGYLMQTIVEEKETRLIEVIVSSIRPLDLLTGKIMAMGLLGLIQVLVWLGSMLFLINLSNALPALASTVLGQIQFPLDKLPVMLLYLLLGYLFFAGGYSMLGAISGSMRNAQQIIGVLILPALLPYFFFTVFAETPNAPLAVVMSMIPITSPLAMMMRLSVTTVPTGEILLSLGFLLIGVIGIIWLTARVFRFQILLAGQAPKLRELPRLMRG